MKLKLRKTKYFYFFIILLSFNIVTAQRLQNKEDESTVKLKLKPSLHNPRNSEGDFIKLNNGKILFIYSHFTDGAGDNSSAYLASRYSLDNGITWSKQDKVVIPQEGKLNIMSVSLLRLNKNKIALFYLRKNSEFDCIPVMRVSFDEAETWSEPKKCITDVKGYYVMNNDRVVKLKSGRLLLPVAQHTTDNEFSEIGRILCYYSDDNGETWERGNEIKNNKKIVTQEPGVIELKNNEVLLFCRTNDGAQYFSISDNGGESWSRLSRSNIKSPLSPASMERIPGTGDLLLVWNNNYQAVKDGGKRTPLNIAISQNEGKTWERVKSIESNPHGWYCYTAIEFVNNDVLLGYCAGDTRYTNGLAETDITRLSVDYLYQTATDDPYIMSGKNGVIKLGCKDIDAEIYYSTDMGFSGETHFKLYTNPFIVNGIEKLQMYAISKNHTKSNLISTFIGEDIYQPALDSVLISGSGLKYKYYKGKFRNTKEFNNICMSDSGIIETFNIKKWKDNNYFGLVFNGYIKISKDDFFSFYLNSNDGSVLSIDDKKTAGKLNTFKESLKEKIVKANEELKKVNYNFKTN